MQYISDFHYWVWLSGFILCAGSGFALSVFLAAWALDYALKFMLSVMHAYDEFFLFVSARENRMQKNPKWSGFLFWRREK